MSSLPSWIRKGRICLVEASNLGNIYGTWEGEWRIVSNPTNGKILLIREDPAILRRYRREPSKVFKCELRVAEYGEKWNAFEVLGGSEWDSGEYYFW
jgi:hypothetical protein